MRAGNLSALVVFEARTITVTDGQSAITWVTDFSEWAEAQRDSEQNCRFLIRYRRTSTDAEISAATHRILWDGCIWTITDSVHDRKRSMLTILSDFSALVEVTHLQSTEREYIDGIPIVRPPE
jgi:hypothetical protein